MKQDGRSKLLSYELTEKKLRKTVRTILETDDEISVRRVAELAGVSLSTAYKHNVLDLLRKAINEEE